MAQMSDSVAPHAIGAAKKRAHSADVSPAEAERRQRRKKAREHLTCLGHTIASWAKANGYSPKAVYKILGGEAKGLYGQGHDIAVKLGIKDGEVGSNNG